LSAVVVGVLALYPLLVYFGISRFGPSGLAAMLLVVCVLRVLVLRVSGERVLAIPQLVLICGGGVLLAAASLVADRAQPMLYYPVLVNMTLLAVFAWSLVSPPSVIERLARLREPELAPEGVVYTRRVTVAWMIFFAFNGAAAFYTAARTPLATWALYNGLVAYLLIGLMFCAELLVRSLVMRRLRR
jgi:uncharacterized membrane protein